MTRFGTAVAAASAMAATLLSTTALAQDWVINKVSGKVSVGAAGSPARALAAGMSVSQGSTITTGANARAMLVRGSETLVVGPNSAIAIQPGQGGLTTTVLQKSGQLTVDVETKQAPHFSVETPFMAAVVKGTKFDVRVSARDASVAVQRGRVQVADFATGQTADITPGQRASVRQGGKPGLNLSGKGTMPAIQSGAPRAPLVTALGRDNAAPAAAAVTQQATSLDSSAGFGPGRSWSGSAAVENKSRGGANNGRGGSAVTARSGNSAAASSQIPGGPDKLAEKSLKEAEKLAEKSLKDADKLAEKSLKDADKLADKSDKLVTTTTNNLVTTTNNLLTSTGKSVTSGISGNSGTSGNSGSSGSNGSGGGKGLLVRR
jgi:hypothetical protein